jgi:hypothetical protein
MNDDLKRFDIWFEKHIGIGIWWRSEYFTFEVSLCLPFFAVSLGLGRRKEL